MRHAVLVGIVAALPFLWTADQAAQRRQAVVSKVAPRYSQERLDRLRQSLVTQIAVRDDAEDAMRAPTPEEAALYTVAAGRAAEVIGLPRGGIALRPDGSHISLAVAQRTADGSIRITDGGPAGPNIVDAQKGASHGR